MDGVGPNNEINTGCGCGEPSPSGCDNVCGSIAEVDECGVCGGDNACLAIDKLIIPQDYSISSIYPNPFNPITNIEYTLPENADIELIVYNIHGRHIQTLMQGFQTAGFHSINWNASNYPSGVYLIRLESSNISFLASSGETGLGQNISQIHKAVLIK
jgi:hypothetical protein